MYGSVRRGRSVLNESRKGNKMEQLSGVMIIIICAGGLLIFLILFIFAKRQIMRFTLRSRRGPHIPIGTDAPKHVRREIERRLDCVQRIAYEPTLLWDEDHNVLDPNKELPPYYYRMRAMDDIKILEKEIAKADGSVRYPHDSLRAFLLVTLASASNAPSQRTIHQFCDMYEHARHDPSEFGLNEYETYHSMLLRLIEAAKTLKSFTSSRKTSPCRTPVKKQTKLHSLDASRLRQPPLSRNQSSLSSATRSTTSAAPSENTSQARSKANLSLKIIQSNTSSEDQLESLELKENEIVSIS